MELIKTTKEYRGFYTIKNDDILREYRITKTSTNIDTFNLVIVDGVAGIPTVYIKGEILSTMEDMDDFESICAVYLGNLGAEL